MFESKLTLITFAFFLAIQGSKVSSDECQVVTKRSDIHRSDVCKGLDLSTDTTRMVQIWSDEDDKGRLSIMFEAYQVINESTTSMKLHMHSSGNASDGIQVDCAMKDSLHFHPTAVNNAKLKDKYQTAITKNRMSGMATVFSNRPLLPHELFGVRITKMKSNAMNVIAIGITSIRPEDHKERTIFTATDATKAGFWMNYIKKDSVSLENDYPFNLKELQENDTVGVTRKMNGDLHLYVNGKDKGKAIKYSEFKDVYGYIDLLPDTFEVTIFDGGFVD